MNEEKINIAACKYAYNFPSQYDERKAAFVAGYRYAEQQVKLLAAPAVSGQLPSNLILYRQAKTLHYVEFCKWLNAKLGNLR
jgi:hypothetical protein